MLSVRQVGDIERNLEIAILAVRLVLCGNRLRIDNVFDLFVVKIRIQPCMQKIVFHIRILFRFCENTLYLRDRPVKLP